MKLRTSLTLVTAAASLTLTSNALAADYDKTQPSSRAEYLAERPKAAEAEVKAMERAQRKGEVPPHIEKKLTETKPGVVNRTLPRGVPLGLPDRPMNPHRFRKIMMLEEQTRLLQKQGAVGKGAVYHPGEHHEIRHDLKYDHDHHEGKGYEHHEHGHDHEHGQEHGEHHH